MMGSLGRIVPALVGLLVSCATRVEARPTGVLDQVIRERVSGWVFESSEPHGRIPVRLRFLGGGQTLLSVEAVADVERPDLKELLKASGDYAYGFRVTLGSTIDEIERNAPRSVRGHMLVELAARDAAGHWFPLALARVPGAADRHFESRLESLQAVCIPGSNELLVLIQLSSPYAFSSARVAAYRIQIWGQAVDATCVAETDKEDATRAKLSAHVTVPANGTVANTMREKGTVFVAIWTADRCSPACEILAGAGEVDIWQ